MTEPEVILAAVDSKRALAGDPVRAPHGKLSTYQNWGCHCEKCTTTARADRARRIQEAAVDAEDTTSIRMPFTRSAGLPETGHDTVILVVPTDLVSRPPGDPGSKPELAMFLLRLATDQARRMREGIREATWWVTRDPAVVAQRAEGDRCPTCLAGADQAAAVMRDDPTAVLAVGRLSWCRPRFG